MGEVLSTSIFTDTATNLQYVHQGRKMWLRGFLNKIGGKKSYKDDKTPPKNCSNENHGSPDNNGD